MDNFINRGHDIKNRVEIYHGNSVHGVVTQDRGRYSTN